MYCCCIAVNLSSSDIRAANFWIGGFYLSNRMHIWHRLERLQSLIAAITRWGSRRRRPADWNSRVGCFSRDKQHLNFCKGLQSTRNRWFIENNLPDNLKEYEYGSTRDPRI